MEPFSQMTIRQKSGQSMLVGFTGTELTPELSNLIKEDKIGGVILFPHNIESPEQVLKLTTDLQSAARKSGHPYPLFVAIDQENGIVRRLKKGVTQFPGSMLLGAANDIEATKAVSSKTAEELKALGVNMNLAPVVDVNNNPQNPVIGVRSFGENASDVTKHGAAFIWGHQESGVMATTKHFPGHGDTDVDSHADLPMISHSMERLRQVELPPFIEAIRQGVSSIMMSHIHFSTLDNKNKIPASLSRNVTTGLLREELGFDGVIMTDCLEMNGIVKKTGTVEGALAALKAGADLPMISHTYELQVQAMDRIENAIKNEEINETIIEQALKRIMTLKEKFLSWEKVPKSAVSVPSFVGGKKHEKLSQEQYKRGVTLVKNKNIIPLKMKSDEKLLVVTVRGKAQSPVEGERRDTPILTQAVSRHHSNIMQYNIYKSPDDQEIESILAASENADQVIFCSDNAYTEKRQALLVRYLLDKHTSLVAVSIGNPYDLASFPDVQAYLAAYEYSEKALDAATDIIFGSIQAQGKLPVSIPSE